MTIVLKGKDSINFVYALIYPSKKTILDNAKYFKELEEKYKITRIPNGFEVECKYLDLDFLKEKTEMDTEKAIVVLEEEKIELRKELKRIEEIREEIKEHSWLGIDENKVKRLTNKYDALDLSINHLKKELANEKKNN